MPAFDDVAGVVDVFPISVSPSEYHPADERYALAQNIFEALVVSRYRRYLDVYDEIPNLLSLCTTTSDHAAALLSLRD